MNREYTTIGDVNDVCGFFEKYNTVNNEHFTSLFGNPTENEIKTMDYILSDVFGSKVLLQKYSDIKNSLGASVLMGRIVHIADNYFYNNWLAIKHSIETALNSDMSKPLESVTTIETQKTGSNETQNKLNAFDGSTASDTDNSNNSYNDNFSTTETKRYSNGKIPTENAKKQIDFIKNNDFIETILNDVVSISCLDVYDDNYICGRTSTSGGGSNPELENRITQCENDITDIKKLIPETATEQNKLATIADVQSGYDDTELRGKIEENTQNIQAIYDDLTGYATKNELQAVENKIPDVTNLATKNELQAVESKIPDVTNLATKSELQAVENQIPDVTNLATKSELQAVENQIPDVTNLATKSEVQAITDLIPSNASTENKLTTKSELQAVENKIPDVTNLATKSELQAVENQIPDVTNLATKSEVQAINNLIPSNASTENKLATMADIGGGGGCGSYYTVGQEVDTGNIYKEGSREKPIYRKVLNVSTISSGGNVDVSTSFTGATRFINITGSYNLKGVRHCLGYYFDGSGYKGVQADVRMSMVRFSVLGSGLTFTDVSLIIEYIK